MWTQQEAIDLATKIEGIAPAFGAHVALTGGCLYKDGPRKDCDLLFYRIRQQKMDKKGLMMALEAMSIEVISTEDYGFVKKALYCGKPLDLLFPEARRGKYK